MILEYFNLNKVYQNAILNRAKEADWDRIRLQGGRDASNLNQNPMAAITQIIMYVSLLIGTYFRDPIMQFVIREPMVLGGLPSFLEIFIILIVPFCLAPFVYLVYRFLKIDTPPIIINIGVCILYGVLCQSVLSKGLKFLSEALQKVLN